MCKKSPATCPKNNHLQTHYQNQEEIKMRTYKQTKDQIIERFDDFVLIRKKINQEKQFSIRDLVEIEVVG